MTSLYTVGAINLDKQTTGGPAVIVDTEIAAAFLWMWQTELRPEGRSVELSRAGQRSLTV